MRWRSPEAGRIALSIACIVCALALVWAGGLPDRASYTGYMIPSLGYVAPELARIAPPFTATLLDGTAFDRQQDNQRTLVLNFWATWCEPCERELPELDAFARDFAQDVRVVAVNLGESPSQITPWLEARALTLPVALDPDGRIASVFQIRAQPTTFMIAPNGIITAIWFGAVTPDALKAALFTR